MRKQLTQKELNRKKTNLMYAIHKLMIRMDVAPEVMLRALESSLRNANRMIRVRTSALEVRR
jgi:hypothetical protein